MVKFAAPQHTQGPLAGFSVKGRWTSVRRDPDWRGDVGYEVYDYRHHWEPRNTADPLAALEMALLEWRDWGVPDHIEVDAVYASQLSPSAGSQDDPFLGVEGTGHDGYERSRRSRERGALGDG